MPDPLQPAEQAPDKTETYLDDLVQRRPTDTFAIKVVGGPDSGQTFPVPVDQPCRMLIGTSVACSLRFSDSTVSRRQAAIEYAGPFLRIVDLESTNGTKINGVFIQEALLAGGETVRMGSTVCQVERAGPAKVGAHPLRSKFGSFIGASEAMRRLYPLVERLAASNVPVVLEGETGTGKEVLAEGMHEASPRASGPFVVFDCTTVPSTLVESVLFGHERGAFTGAHVTHRGVFEQADGGTLLIDEIGDLDLSLQPKLLRAVQRSEVQRVGGNQWIRVDVRLIAATRRNLDKEVQEGRFRDDLFFRLNVGRVEIPPLRNRRGDVALLAVHFWSQLGSGGPFPTEFLERTRDYSWPGNVRELENAVARYHVLGSEALAATSSASATTAEQSEAMDVLASDYYERNVPLPRARQLIVEGFEAAFLQKALDEEGGNVTRAAAAAGIGRRHMHTLLAKTLRNR